MERRSMTIRELSQLYYLRREIEADQRRLEELETAAASPGIPRYDGMPRGPGYGDPVSRLVAEIVELKEMIAAKQLECIRERRRLEEYIARIPDSLTRQIFTLRFVEGRSWAGTAMGVGGGNTEESVRQRAYRCLKSLHE